MNSEKVVVTSLGEDDLLEAGVPSELVSDALVKRVANRMRELTSEEFKEGLETALIDLGIHLD